MKQTFRLPSQYGSRFLPYPARIYIVVSELSTRNAKLFGIDDRLVIHFNNGAWVRRNTEFVGYCQLLFGCLLKFDTIQFILLKVNPK